MDLCRGTLGFLLFLSLNLCFTIQTGEENCEPGIRVRRYTSHNVSVGDRLKISCPVSFCDNSPPSVTWFKLEADGHKPVNMSDCVKTEWEIKGHSVGIYYFIIENVRETDRGEYQCQAENHVGHTIMVHVTGKERNCEPEFHVPRDTSHNVSVGDGVTIDCPVSFCDNSTPTVTWVKHGADDYKHVNMSDRVKTEWEIICNFGGTSYFIIENVQESDRGQYQCRAGDYMGHNITVHVTDHTFTDVPDETQLWLYLYTAVGTVGFVVIVIVISVLSMRGCNVNDRNRETDINMTVSQPAVVEGEEMDAYAALQQPSQDLYQNIVDSAGALGSKHQRLHSEGDYENVNNFAN